ncbi:MAG: nicotinamide-nucleotide amidohydrolase family protein, partial [Planctomycetota bacterium]|nr:nicotinamide-nucleotide amidohydrolase family protein [Planctomycetota bacterium]
VEALADEVAAAWGGHVFGRDDETLEAALGRERLARGLDLAPAASGTGGGGGAAITAVAGSSAWYPGGVVTYADERKVEELDVDAGVIQRCGAVSGEVVSAMARGVRRRCGASLGVATSGVAGPGGGSEEKPVGTVWISVVDDHGEDTRCFRFPGDRAIVRRRTVLAALQMARLRVIGERLPLLWERSVGATGRSS